MVTHVITVNIVGDNKQLSHESPTNKDLHAIGELAKEAVRLASLIMENLNMDMEFDTSYLKHDEKIRFVKSIGKINKLCKVIE